MRMPARVHAGPARRRSLVFALMAKGPGRHSGCSVHFPGQGAIPASLLPVLISLFGRLFSAFVMNLLYTHLAP